MMNILLVDDHMETCDTLSRFLSRLGYSVTVRDNGNDALMTYSAGNFPLVITDICMPGMSGIELLKAVREMPAGMDTNVVLMTGYCEVETAVQAIRAGAYDYLLKPVNVEELALLAKRVADHQALKKENRQLQDKVREVTAEAQSEIERLQKIARKVIDIPSFGTHSQCMRDVAKRCLQYHKDRSIPVLIQGETGTGKELAAQLIHCGNSVSERPFVAVNCAALTPSLFESELFGYEPGSFTGGLAKGRKGKLDAAEGGTLFLDEIGDMPIELQAKLLRVLQEKEFYRVGGLEKIKTDVRFIFATHVDLPQRVNQGRFRQDLYFRLRVGTLTLPPLRERKEDIMPLARCFLGEAAKEKQKRFFRIGKTAASCLVHYEWPGNVRELRNVIEAAVVLFDGDTIRPEHLVLLDKSQNLNLADHKKQLKKEPIGEGKAPDNTVYTGTAEFVIPKEAFSLDELNYQVLQKTVQLFNGNLTRAANHLGISPRTLSYRLKAREDKSKES